MCAQHVPGHKYGDEKLPSVLVWAALRRTDELCPIQKAGGGWAQAQERMPSNSVYMSVFVLIIVTGYYSVHPKH